MSKDNETDFELAFRMKELGYPQPGDQQLLLCECGQIDCWGHMAGPHAYFPTSDELVEALGDSLGAMARTEEDEWRVGNVYDNDAITAMSATAEDKLLRRALMKYWILLHQHA